MAPTRAANASARPASRLATDTRAPGRIRRSVRMWRALMFPQPRKQTDRSVAVIGRL